MSNPIVVLGTNIFISSIFWEGASYILAKKAVRQEIIVFISSHITGEIRTALMRDFNLEKQEVEDIITALLSFTILINPKEEVKVIKDDPKDDRILECALSCNAEYIISQDKHLLSLKMFGNIRIVSPQEFLTHY